jgi:hypothetical protein
MLSEVSATSLSLVQRNPTDCGASLCVIKKSRERGGHSPRWAAEPEKNYVYLMGPPLYMWSVVDRNVVMVRMSVILPGMVMGLSKDLIRILLCE